MRAHRLDPVSAVLGLVALVAAIGVMAGSTVPFDADVGPWLAVVALAFGIVLLPWGLRRSPSPIAPAESEHPSDPPDPADDARPTTFA